MANADGKIPLQSITCRDADSDYVILKTLDSVGAVVKSWIWTVWGGESGEEKGWVNRDDYMFPEEPVYFEPGQSLWVEGQTTENAFVSAGQVGTDDISIQLQNGATLTGNASPVEIDMQDILCRDADSDYVILKTLDSVGAVVNSYIWTVWGGERGEEKGWVNRSDYMFPSPTVKFAPGEGLWIEGVSKENIVTFPGVELK